MFVTDDVLMVHVEHGVCFCFCDELSYRLTFSVFGSRRGNHGPNSR